MVIKLSELHGDRGMLQKKKRVGRGESSGQGKTAGKGHKGETARAGTPKGGHFEGGQTPITRRLPKRGFSNLAWSTPADIINISQLNRFEAGTVVDFNALVGVGLISKNTARVKVLGNGAIEKKLTISAHSFSASAREKIEAAGGKCEVIEKQGEAAKPATA